MSVSTDQALPPEFGAEFWKRDDQLQRVFTLRLDTNFHYVDFKGCVSVLTISTLLEDMIPT